MRTTFAVAAGLAAVQPGLATLAARDSVTSNVYFGDNTGTPQHLASGLLYGVPDAPNQVQDHWYTDMGFNYLRAGGAQLSAPARGWVWGMEEYKNRFQSALSNYRTARKYGAKFVFLIHDLWGADGTQNSSTPYPGDNGNWAYWDQYFEQLVSDMKANSMIEDVIIDIWNEPDLGTVFWGKSQDQYLQYWGRSFAQFRKTFGSSVLLSGPAASGEPHLTNTWWTNYMQFVAQNQSIPDQWAWHMETGGGNMIEANKGLNDLLAKYSLPSRPVNINEYAVFSEQVPAGSAWWISQLERVNAIGLRGNWLSGNQLHDFLASLLSKPNAQDSSYSYTANNYYPNGDYQVYKFYNLNMTGHRVSTTPSDDGFLDSYATVDTNKARVLVGVRQRTGTWTLQLNNLDKLGLPASGVLNVHTLGFPASINAHYGEIDGPVDLGVFGHSYSGGVVSFPIFQNDQTTAYMFEFDIVGSSSTTTTTVQSSTRTTSTAGSSSTNISASSTTSAPGSTSTTSTVRGSSSSTSSTTSASSTVSTSVSTSVASSTASTSSTSSAISSTSSVTGSSTSISTSRSSTLTTSAITTSVLSSTTSGITSSASGSSTSSTSASLFSTSTSSSKTSSITSTGSTLATTTSTLLTTSSNSGSSTLSGSSSTTTSTSAFLTSSTFLSSKTTGDQSSSTSSPKSTRTFTTSAVMSSSGTNSQVASSWQAWSQWSTVPATTTSSRSSTVSTLSDTQSWSQWASTSLDIPSQKTITITQTYVVPCSTGLATLTTTITTTHCGCSETPIPTIRMTVTTITPSSGWPVSTMYVATVPVQGSMSTPTKPFAVDAMTGGSPQNTKSPSASSTQGVSQAVSTWATWTTNRTPDAASTTASGAPVAKASSLASTPANGTSTWAAWNSGNTNVAVYTGTATGRSTYNLGQLSIAVFTLALLAM